MNEEKRLLPPPGQAVSKRRPLFSFPALGVVVVVVLYAVALSSCPIQSGGGGGGSAWRRRTHHVYYYYYYYYYTFLRALPPFSGVNVLSGGAGGGGGSERERHVRLQPGCAALGEKGGKTRRTTSEGSGKKGVQLRGLNESAIYLKDY